ncbi:MAG: DUF3039 domain-containing protein [Beutenbergiaceae bacterium]
MSEPLPPAAPAAPERSGAGSTDVLERDQTREQKTPGDNERYAHYVKKEKITAAAVTGGPVVALCGKVWTPNRNPANFPVCPVCKEIYEGISGGGDEGNSGRRGFFGFGSKR